MFILASASPRRKELLQQIGACFRVQVSEAEEVSGPSLPPGELVKENAVRKAEAVAKLHPDIPVLGADTVVFLDGRVFGKPQNEKEASAMLHVLSGREHEVATGFAWIKQGRILTEVVTTRVFFGTMTDEDIAAYVRTGEPLDKAGAYAVQGRAAMFIEAIDGSFSNVVGLPLFDVCRLARKAGIDLYEHHGEGSSPGGASA